MKKVVLMVLILMMGNLAIALEVGEEIKEGFLKYKVLEDGKTLEVSGYTEIPEDGKVVIPEMVEEMKVVAVGEKAFFKCNSLIRVEMQGVKIVGDGAFYQCKALASVEMQGVETVGIMVFIGCENLKLDNQIIFTDEKGVMYAKIDDDNAKVLNYTKEIKGELIIPKNITIDGKEYAVLTVGSGAFVYCDALTEVSMLNVKMVDQMAFGQCKELKKVRLTQTGCCFYIDSFKDCKWKPGVGNKVVSDCK